MPALYEMTGEMRQLQELMESVDDEGENAEVALRDTMEAMQLDFNDKAVAIVKLSQALEGDTTAIDAEIKRLQERKRTINNRRGNLRDYLRHNMETAGIKKVECPLFSITLTKGRDQVKVDDEAALPDDFMNVKTEIKPDKTAIAKALKAGQEVPGAHLAQGQSGLRVK